MDLRDLQEPRLDPAAAFPAEPSGSAGSTMIARRWYVAMAIGRVVILVAASLGVIAAVMAYS